MNASALNPAIASRAAGVPAPAAVEVPSAEDLRAEFLLDPDIVFLNHGSFGACPRPVFEVYQAWQRELERQPVAFLGRRFPDLMRAARTHLGRAIGCAPDDVVFVPNATHGVNVVAHSLALGPGDEVLTSDHEYGACDRAWRLATRKTGATYRAVPIDAPLTTHAAFVDAFWAAVGPRTRVIFLSHITSPTGVIFPVAEICRRARAAGILTVIDGAHAPGQLPLDMEAIGADAYTGNLHKWPCAPKGAAFLYVRRELQPRIEPLVVSWGFEPEPAFWPYDSPFVARHEWTGTADPAAYLSVPAALDFQRDRHWDAVRARCHRLARETRARLTALPGVAALHPDDDTWYAQMIAVTLPPLDAVAVKSRLYDDFGIEVPLVAWNARGLLRVSVQGYNTHGDIDALVAAMEVVLGV